MDKVLDQTIQELGEAFVEVLHNAADMLGAKCPVCGEAMKHDTSIECKLDGGGKQRICDNCYLKGIE